MPSGSVRIAAAIAQDSSNGKAGNEKIASLLKEGKDITQQYPVKAKKK